MWLPSTVPKAHWSFNPEHKLRKSGALFQAVWILLLESRGCFFIWKLPSEQDSAEGEMTLIPQPIGSPLSCSRKAGGLGVGHMSKLHRDKVHLVSRDQCLNIKALT